MHLTKGCAFSRVVSRFREANSPRSTLLQLATSSTGSCAGSVRPAAEERREIDDVLLGEIANRGGASARIESSLRRGARMVWSRLGRLRNRWTGIANLADKSCNLDLPSTAARLRDVVAILHAHQRIHGNTERLLDAQRHFRR